MKKIVGALFAALIINCGLAHADVITGALTGDNNLYMWTGSAWQEISTNWQSPVTETFTVTSPTDNVYFAVTNNAGTLSSNLKDQNPAGFLASFTDTTTNGTFYQNGSSTLLSNTSNFEVSKNPVLDYGYFLANVNPNSSLYKWTTPTSEGVNGSGVWGNIPSENSSADWIWTKNDSGDYYTEDNFAVFEVNLGVTNTGSRDRLLTPEPTTLLLFAFAGALIVLLRKRLGFAR
jgi:hypothetical protein